MEKSAISLVLIMITGSLAGCLAGDSDGVPEISLTDEDITGLFDDYFMDFVNNSSVTVVNEIHYHNNTTVIEGDDSSTSSIVYNSNGSGGSEYPYYILDVTFNVDSVQEEPIGAPDYSLVYFNATWGYYDFNFGDYRQGVFSVSCGNYYLLVNSESANNSSSSLNNRTYWENNNYYIDAWMNIHNQTVIDILENYANEQEVISTCGAWEYFQYNQDWNVVYEHAITIPEGYVLSCVGAPNYNGIYQFTMFYRSDYLINNHGTDSTTDGWYVWGEGTYYERVAHPTSGDYRYAYGPQADMSVDDMPHECYRFAGTGSESDFKLTVTFDAAHEIRVLFFYQLIPIQSIVQS